MRVVVAILLVTNYGLEPARMESLWSQGDDNWLIRTPGFWKVIREKRFRVIKRYLRVTPQQYVDDHPSDRARKIRVFLNTLMERFQAEFVLHERITIDEVMIPLKGRWGGKQ